MSSARALEDDGWAMTAGEGDVGVSVMIVSGALCAVRRMNGGRRAGAVLFSLQRRSSIGLRSDV
ncbi:MAG: hypothetical protein B7X76_07180 [Azorhizobium sp. 39-67-5]|nr:MAG: hypothetical protein B7X76_07180 [Azorhizobium sp. 39-67-5]